MLRAFSLTCACRFRLRRAAMGLAMFMALGVADAADAQQPRVSTGVIPLSGFVGAVRLEGWLHVVLWVPPNPTSPANLHANLPAMDVIATDTALGRNYIAYGAGSASPVCSPVDPCNGAIAGFNLRRLPSLSGDSCQPTDPCRAIPFNLNLSVVVNGDGTINTGLSSAKVAECGVDIC